MAGVTADEVLSKLLVLMQECVAEDGTIPKEIDDLLQQASAELTEEDFDIIQRGLMKAQYDMAADLSAAWLDAKGSKSEERMMYP